MSPSSLASLLLALPLLASALTPGCAPGGNFDLSKWQLQLPTAGSNGGVETKSSSELEGCKGYSSKQYFYTDSSDGSMVMKAPGSDSGCAKTSGSQHCRTEFRETSPSSWDPASATNRLSAQLKGTSGSNTVIGQVFQANSGYSKPFAELYYGSSGDIDFRVAMKAEGGAGQAPNQVGNVPRGTKFSYEIRFEKKKLSISVNGGGFKTVKTFFDTPGAYFKAGDYNQADDSAEVHFYQLKTTH